MSYLIRTRENRLIAIDGGWEEDAPRMIEKMKEVTGEETPTVALWILTHPHPDHFGVWKHLSKDKELCQQVKVERIAYQQPVEPIPKTGFSNGNVQPLYDRVANAFGAEISIPHTGEVWDIDGVKLRFFFTPEDFDRLKDGNEYSLIFRVQGTHSSVMFTGDTYPRIAARVALKFWNELKSDVCQLAHHGLNGADAGFYARVDAKTALVPISVSGDRAIMQDYVAGIQPCMYAIRNAEQVIKAYEGDVAIEL